MPDYETANRIVIEPGRLSGTVKAPAGKSELIRAVFCAALCRGESRIDGIYLSEDVRAALRCAEALGAQRHKEGDSLFIDGRKAAGDALFDCGESAAVLRFAIPAAMAVCGGGCFVGHGRLMERPLEPYCELFRQWGTEYTLRGNRLTVKGSLPRGEHSISGRISSQFVSGLLLALPAAGGGRVCVRDGLSSSGYADMTCDVMRRAGVKVQREGTCFSVCGEYAPFQLEAAGDWSQAAFWYAAKHFGAEIEIGNLKTGSLQPDEKIAEFSARLREAGDLSLDLGDTPDLLPPLAAMAAVRSGECVFTGCERLRYKESNRLKSVVSVLGRLGADISSDGDTIRVRGKSRLRGGRADSFGDHRIAMMAAVTAAACTEPVEIIGADCVKKSYPDFFREYDRLGGNGCVRVYG